MYLTQSLFLSPDFYKFYCTTRASGGFLACAYRTKHFLALLKCQFGSLRSRPVCTYKTLNISIF